MGILNITPDSFYDGGFYNSTKAAIDRAAGMVHEGVDIIDVGGESTRPGAKTVPLEQELERVIPVIESIASRFDVVISVDTTKHEVARAAIQAGAHMINDISGLTFDLQMLPLAVESGVYCSIMHTAARPEIMQSVYSYDNVVDEVLGFLSSQIEAAMTAGMSKEKIIIDPGIGFGKSLDDNYALLSAIPRFKQTGVTLLIGLSRKSLIGKLYDFEADRLPATIALNTASVLFGADIIRVHDVREHVLAMRAVEKLTKAVR